MTTYLLLEEPTGSTAPTGHRWSTHVDEVLSGRATAGLGIPGSGRVNGPVDRLDGQLSGLGRLVSLVASGGAPVAVGLGEGTAALLEGDELRVLEGRVYVVRPSLSGARVVVVARGGVVHL